MAWSPEPPDRVADAVGGGNAICLHPSRGAPRRGACSRAAHVSRLAGAWTYELRVTYASPRGRATIGPARSNAQLQRRTAPLDLQGNRPAKLIDFNDFAARFHRNT
jgi:hypothetical protein